MCDSMKPGSTVAPAASITRVCGPAGAMTSALVPTREDPVAAHGHRLGPRAGRVHGQDAGVLDDQISGHF